MRPRPARLVFHIPLLPNSPSLTHYPSLSQPYVSVPTVLMTTKVATPFHERVVKPIAFSVQGAGKSPRPDLVHSRQPASTAWRNSAAIQFLTDRYQLWLGHIECLTFATISRHFLQADPNRPARPPNLPIRLPLCCPREEMRPLAKEFNNSHVDFPHSQIEPSQDSHPYPESPQQP